MLVASRRCGRTGQPGSVVEGNAILLIGQVLSAIPDFGNYLEYCKRCGAKAYFAMKSGRRSEIRPGIGAACF
jgi:hypothetical protein